MPLLMQRVVEKAVVTISMVGCAASILLVSVGGYFSVLCTARFTFGFFQIVLISYIMAWVETFGATKFQKAFQFHLVLIG